MLGARALAAAAAQPPPKSPPRVVVVGGGVGGLAAAGRLARAGCSVTLLEQNDEVGGRCQSMELGDGCRVDTGPSLLLFRDKYEEAFEGLGTSLEAEGVELLRVGPAAYRVFFGPAGEGEGESEGEGEGGGGGAAPAPLPHIDLLNDAAAMAAQLEALEPGAGAQYGKFLTMATRALRLGVPYFIDRELAELAADARGLADLLPAAAGAGPLELLAPHDWVLSRYFRSARIRAALSFQDLYVGLTPRSAPGVFSLLAATELVDGVWYPRGGFGAVRDALRRAAERAGAAVRTRARVAAVVTARGRAAGVALAGGERLPADVVLCNRDLPAAYDLLGADGPTAAGGSSSSSDEASDDNDGVAAYAAARRAALGGLDYSAGVVAFYWRLTRRLNVLLHHNVFLSDAPLERAWRPARAASELLPSPNFYVHCPSRTDPSAAPRGGGDSVMVLLPVAHGRDVGAAGYDGLVAAGRARVLAALAAAGAGDVRAAIAEEVVVAPPGWEERYGLRHGAAFGLSHGLGQLSIFRPPQKEARVGGMYFVGASTRPGNGVPLVLIGAKLVAARVLADLGMPAATAR